MTAASQTVPVWPARIRSIVAWILAILACAALGVYVVVHWAERQILTTDNWVALVSPLPKQAVVSSALGSYISDQVFASAPIEQTIADALPPRASFLAGPLTDQLHTITTRTAQRLVASDGFQTVWAGANRIAMNRLVTQARGQAPERQGRLSQKFNIDISQVAPQLQKALGSAASAIPALQPVSQKAITVSTNLHARPKPVHGYIKAIDWLAAVLPLAILACFLGALAISRHRRRIAFGMAVIVGVLMLLELIALKWLHQTVVDQVRNPANVPAISYIYDTLVGWLRHMVYWVLAFAAVLIIALLLAGPARWAKSFRSFIHLERLQRSAFMRGWRVGRAWIRRWEYYLWLAAGIIALIVVAAFVTVNGQAILRAALAMLAVFALIHILSTPHEGPTKSL